MIQDEPGLADLVDLELAKAGTGQGSQVRLELGFGYSSLLEDPDIAEGMGGGIYLSYEFVNRLGAELSLFLSHNPYEDSLGELGTSFLAGNVTLGPVVRLTPMSSRVGLWLDTAMGAYLIVPFFQDNIWTLGVSGGLTFSLKITRWLGLSLKWRYHLFNLKRISGPEMRDLKALMEVGVIDRMEIPLCLSFFF